MMLSPQMRDGAPHLEYLEPYSWQKLTPFRSIFTSSLRVNLRAGLLELFGLFAQARFQRHDFTHLLLRGVLADFLGDLHRAEMRAAHRAEVRQLRAFLRQRLIVKFARQFWIKRETKLIFPAKLEARFRQRIVL